MAIIARLRALEERHAALDRQIKSEDGRPQPDGGVLSQMKRDKLRLKEEMEKLKEPAR
ncbi:YdcH family protein [Humitalea sp. 24SJ18S-53]|uniref:YdcH family protein n=1 Tax=Humitalea sp. 24SJ18S-53 TaxID=3422307 RepID=UPI003D67EC33